MSVVALVIAPTVAIDNYEIVEKTEDTFTLDSQEESYVTENTVLYKDVVKK